MDVKFTIMNLIMSGNYKMIEIKKEKEKFQTNCFVYQGDYFQCYLKQNSFKSVGEISLLEIEGVEEIEENIYQVHYKNNEKIIIQIKKNRKKEE